MYALRARLAKSDIVASAFTAVMKSSPRLVLTFTRTLRVLRRSKHYSTSILQLIIIIIDHTVTKAVIVKIVLKA